MKITGINLRDWSYNLDRLTVSEAVPESPITVTVNMQGTIIAVFDIFADSDGSAPLPLKDLVTVRMAQRLLKKATLQISLSQERQSVSQAFEILFCTMPMPDIVPLDTFLRHSFLTSSPLYQVVPQNAQSVLTVCDTEMRKEANFEVTAYMVSDSYGDRTVAVDISRPFDADSFAQISLPEIMEALGVGSDSYEPKQIIVVCGQCLMVFYFTDEQNLSEFAFVSEFKTMEYLYLPAKFQRVAKLDATQIVTARGESLTADRLVTEEITTSIQLSLSVAQWMKRLATSEAVAVRRPGKDTEIFSLKDFEITEKSEVSAQIKMTLTPVSFAPRLPFNPALENNRIFDNPFNQSFQ